jgi:UDP-N-acetylmuramoyl-tripeptide--D-alanyl-D-alanine ligase
MKKFLIEQLSKTLNSLAIRTLAKFKPTVVAVTGSVGKSSTKEAVFSVLSAFRKTRRNVGNFNGELGLPLTILGDWSAKDLHVIARDAENVSTFSKILFFKKVILLSMLRLYLPKFLTRYVGGYPEILVLEYAADKPGDIKYLVEIAKPNISVLTAVGDIPVHVEFYDSPEAVLREKARIIEALPAAGLAVLNGDEDRVYECDKKTRATALSFGFSDRCDVQVRDFENKLEMINGILRPTGIIFKLGYDNAFVPIRISGTLGKTQAYAAAAATCVGLAFNLNLVQIAEALTYYQVPNQRMRFLAGIHHSTLIDDSYNASPLAMRSAIETVASIKAKRKVAIIGDMRELGEWSRQAHREIGELAGKTFDVIVAIGPESKVYIEMAAKHRFSKKNLMHVNKIEEVLPQLRDVVKEGDLVLIKASHSIGLSKAVATLQEV